MEEQNPLISHIFNSDLDKYTANNIGYDQVADGLRVPVAQQAAYNRFVPDKTKVSFREFQAALGVDPVVEPGSIKDLFRVAEENPKDGYSSYNPNSKSGAWGRYQFIWGTHKAPIKNLTNIDNTDDFLKSKYAQEEYMDHVINNEYTSHLPTLRELAKNNDKYKNYNDNELMYLEHHEGLKGAKHLLTTGESLFGSIPAIDKAITKMRNYQGKLDRSIAADVQVADSKQKKEIKGDLMTVGEQLEKEALTKTNAKLNLEYNQLGFGDKIASAYKRGGLFKVLSDALPFTDADATPTEVKAAKLDIVASNPKYKELVKSEEDLSKLLNNYNYKRDQEVEKLASKINDDIKSDINTDAGIFDYFSGEKYYKKNGKEYVNVSLGKFGDIFVEGIDRSKTEVELSKLMSLKEHPAITPNMSVQDKQELNNALLRAQSDYAKADILRQDHYGTKTQDYLEFTNKSYRNKLAGLTTKYNGIDNIDPNDPEFKDLERLQDEFNKSLENFKAQPLKYKLASEHEAVKNNIIKNYDKDIKAMTGWDRFLHKSDRLLNELPEYTNDSFIGLGKVIGTGIDAGLNTDIATTSLIEDAYAAKTIRSTAETNAGLIETAYLGNDVYAKFQNGVHIGFVDSDFYDINLPEEEAKRLSTIAKRLTPADISTSFNWKAINEGIRTGIMDFAPLLIGGAGIVNVTKGIGGKAARNKILSKVGQSMINLADNQYFTTLASTFGGFAGKVTKGAIEEGGLIDAGDIFVTGVTKTALEAAIEMINPIEGKILTGNIFNSKTFNVKQFASMVANKGFVPSIGDLAKITSKNLLAQGVSEGVEELAASLTEPLVLNNILNNVIDTNFSTDVNLRDVAEATLIGSLSGLALGAGTNIRYAGGLRANIVRDAVRTSLQNETFFNKTLDNLKNQQLEDIEKSNSETKTEDAKNVTDNYNHVKAVYDQAKNDAAFVFKKSVKGNQASESFQRNVSDIAFEKAILDKIDAPTDIEAEIIKDLSSKLGQDLKDIQVYYANGFNGYATINSINKDLGKDARLTPKEYEDNIDTIFESFKESVAKAGKTKLSEEAKQRMVKVDMGVIISTIKNGKATETAQKQADDLKEEMKQAEEKVAKEEAKAKVNESFNKGENPTSNGVPDDLVEQVLKEEKATVTQRLAGIKPNDINGKLSYNKENFQVLIDDHPSQAVFIQAEQARLEKELSDSQNANYRDQVVKAAGTPVTTDTFAERYEGKPELEENDNKQIDDAYVDHVTTIKEELNEEFNPEELKEALNDKPLLEKISNPEEFPDYAEVAAETIPGNNIPDITTPTVTPEFIIDDSPVPTDEELTSSTDKVADIESRRQEESKPVKEEIEKIQKEIDILEGDTQGSEIDSKEIEDAKKERNNLRNEDGSIPDSKIPLFNKLSKKIRFLQNSFKNQVRALVDSFSQLNNLSDKDIRVLNRFVELTDYTFEEVIQQLEKRNNTIYKRPSELDYFEDNSTRVDKLNETQESADENTNERSKLAAKELGIDLDKVYYANELDAFVQKHGSKQTKFIWNLIKNIAEKLKIPTKFLLEGKGNNINKSHQGEYSNGQVANRASLLTSPDVAARTIVHELVHGVTSYIISAVKNNQTELLKVLTQKQINAAKKLSNLLRELQTDSNTKDFYGSKNEHEILAELTHDGFVEALQNKKLNFVKEFLDYILDILGIPTNAYDEALGILKDMIETPVDYVTRGFVQEGVYYSKKENSKLQELKNRLKELRQQLDKINAKYDAELAALENTKPVSDKKADIERRRQELESSREIETLYDLTTPIAEDSKEIVAKIDKANELNKNAQAKNEQALKETDEEKIIALNSDADSLNKKAQILDKEVKESRDTVINNTPIKQAIKSAKILGQRLLNKIKLAAKSNEWVSSMPISKEEFTKLEYATKRLSVKNMGEVTSNSEVIPDILLIEEINAKYDAELAALEDTTPSDVTAEDLDFLGPLPTSTSLPESVPEPKVTVLQAPIITTISNTNPVMANENVVVDGPMYIQYLNGSAHIRIKLADNSYRILPFADVKNTKSVLTKYGTEYFTIVPVNDYEFIIKTDANGTVHKYDEQFIIDNISIGDTVYYEYDPNSKYNSGSNVSDEVTVAVYVKDGKLVTPETEGATTKYIGRISSGKTQATSKANVLSHIKNTEGKKQIPVLVDNLTMFTNNQFGKKRDITIAELLEHKENLKVIGVEFTDPTIINNGLIRNARFLTPSNDTNNGIEKIPSNVKVHPHYLGSLAIYIKGQLLKLDTKVLKDTPVLFNKLKAQLDQFEKAKGLKEVISVVQILRGNGDEIVFKNVRDPKSEFKNEEAENPRGGIESIYYHFNRKGDDKYTMVKKPTDSDFMTKDQLLSMLGNYRVHIDHNLIDNDFYLEDVVQHAVQAEVPLNQPFFNNPRLYLANNIQANPEVKKDIVITEEQKSKPDVPSTPAADTPKKVFKKTKFKIGSKTNSPELTKGGDWIRERFSEIGVEISDELLENLINGIQLAPGEKVWGAFHRASVILASDANVKVERHESYHVLFNLFLNDKQRDQIRAEVRSKFGKDLTDLQVEEKLADLFEDYKDRLLFDNDWSKANPKIANFFNKIYKWLYKNFNILQSYLTDSVTIDKLFYQLENNIIGRDFLGNRKQSVQNLFKRNLDNILNEPKFSISNWTSAQTHRYATFVNKDLFSMYLETEYDSSNLNEIVDNDTTVDSVLAGYVKNFDDVVQAYIEQTPTADQSVIHDIAKQFKSNKDFQFIVKKNLKITQNIVIDAEYEDTVDDYLEDNEDVNENTNDSESQRESWQGGAALVDSKSRASSRLRGLFSNYIYKKEIDDNGKKGLEPFTYDDTNQFKFYGANEIHNLLLEKLSNSTSKKDMVERLNSLLDNYTWMIDLLRDIRGIDGETALELYNDGKLKIDYDLELQNIDSVAGGWILKSMWYAIGDQKNNDPVQLLYSKGSARLDNLRADNKGKSIKNSMLYNIDVLSSSESKLKSLGKELTDLYNKVIQPAYKNDPQDYLDFIKLLGYEVDIDQARELSSVNKTASVSGNRLTNRAYILDRFKAITNSFKSYNADNNLSSLQSDLTLDFTGLANHISDYTLNPGNLSFKNVIGELEFAHIPNNYITRQFDLMKADPKKWVAGKISSVRGALTYPVVLQARLPFYKDLLSNYQTYFGIAIDGFFNTENQNSGKQYKDYTEQDILVNDINRYIAGPGPNKKGGVYNFGVFSDAPVRYVYYGNKFTKEQIVDKLTAIVHGEFERIQLVRQLNNVTSYKNIANTGLIIHTIPSLNKLLPFIPETWSGLNDSQIYDPNVSTKSVTDVIKNHIDNYLSTEAYGTYIDKFKEYGQITEDSNIHDIKLADKTKLLKDSKNLLFEYFINQFYVNATMQIVFAGDPAFYKPNDFHKSGVKSYQDVLKPEFNPYYLQTGIDSVKRFKQLVSPMITGWFNDPTFKVIILKDIYDKVSSEIPAALKAAKYEEKVESVLSKEYGITADGKINSKKANLSDAGAYHTLGRRVAIMKAYQSWKPKYQAIIDRLEQGKGTKSDLEFVMQPLKPFLFTNQHRMESTGTEANPMVMQVPIQLKLSETVLIPQVAYITNDGKVLNPSRNDFDNNFSNYKYKDLAKILYLMQNSNADMVVFESGSKAASFNILDLNNFSGEYVQRAKDDFKSNLIGDDLDDSLIEDTIYENLMTSISTDNTLELSNDDYGDQMSVPEKTLDAKVGEGTQERKIMTAGIDPNHKFTFMGRTYNGYEVNELLDKISIDSVKESLDKVVEKIGTYAKFTNYLRNQLVDKNASVDVLDALQVQEDGLTRVPLETLGKKAEHVANSLFKKTSKNKKFGASLVNQPGVGFSEELKLVFKELPDGTKVVDYYEAAIPAYSKHLLKYADKDGVINPADLPDKLLRAFFYRIPTEDKYSMFPIKIVKFLPQSQGGTIILPAEATVIAGLDFDIDKLYGYFYNFTATYDGNFIDSLTKKLNNDFGATFTPNEVSKLVDDVTDSNMELLSESFEDPQAVISIINSEISKSLSRPSLKVIESSFDSKEGRDNLRLDIYNSLVNTPAYTKAMLRIGNKARLIKLRDTLSTEATSGYKSFADPSVQAENSAKNIIGKRLIGIFANANAFINLIQGNTELLLSNPLTFNENTYTSIGANIENITKNISELLFASTEDVKDPVLGPLNINESTANVLITMLALNIPFEESIQFLNSPVMKYISKMHQTQPSRRLNAIYAGSPFNVDPNIQQILATAEEFSKVISAAKIDTGNVGPDLNVVNNKIKSINSAIKRSRSEYGIFNNVNEILPNIYYNSSKKEYEVSGETVKVKQLIAYTQVLATEMNILKNYFSYLTGDFYNYTSLFEVLTKSSNLRDDQLKTIIYATYDYFIQHMLLEKVPNFGKIVTNLPEYFSKHEFSPETAPLKNVLEVDINKNNNTKQILMKVDNFTSAQIEYYKGLFEILIKEDIDSTDPGHINFGTNLAIYSLLLGTSFSYRGFSKLLPNIFWNTAIGKDIRNIINGKSSLNFDSSDLFTGVIYNNFTKLVPKIDSNDVQVTGATYKILKDSDKNNKGNHLPYIFFNTKVGKIYTNTLLQHVGDGVYTEVLKSSGKSYIKDYTFSMPTVNNNDDVFTEFEEFIVSDNFDALPEPIDNGEFSYGTDEDYNDFIKDEPPTRDELDDSPPIKPC